MLPAEPVIYEQPINEHVRVCLRLEHLFNQVLHWMHGTQSWDSRAALAAILEILNVLDRPDLKTKLVKELGRYISVLSKFAETPHIDRGKLAAVQDEIEQTLHHLHGVQGRLAQPLRDNDFLTSIRQHLLTPGGGCSFDVPIYHYWLHQPPAERIAQLTHWMGWLKSIRMAVELTLRLIRQSSAPQLRAAEEGFYQATLDAQTPYQLVRVALSPGAGVYPEISVGRHGLSIRFYTPSLTERSTQAKEEIKFHLTCCVF
jgi:cell division protein ZapD